MSRTELIIQQLIILYFSYDDTRRKARLISTYVRTSPPRRVGSSVCHSNHRTLVLYTVCREPVRLAACITVKSRAHKKQQKKVVS